MPEDLKKSAIWNAPRETEACNTDSGTVVGSTLFFYATFDRVSEGAWLSCA
jgi:hypothetical protein